MEDRMARSAAEAELAQSLLVRQRGYVSHDPAGDTDHISQVWETVRQDPSIATVLINLQQLLERATPGHWQDDHDPSAWSNSEERYLLEAKKMVLLLLLTVVGTRRS